MNGKAVKVIHPGPLEEESICLTGAIMSKPYGGFDQTTYLLDTPSMIAEHLGEYAVEGAVICFVSENGVFAKFRSDGDEETLLAAGFRLGEFEEVPLADDDYPLYQISKYGRMRNEAQGLL